MSFRNTFAEVLADAKRAFESTEKTYYEKCKSNKKETKPYFKSIGFVGGTKSILVYR